MDKIFLNISFSLLCGVFIIFALSSLGFIFGVSIKPFYTVAGLISCFTIFNYRLYLNKLNRKNAMFLNIGFILLIFILYLLALNMWDASWDGRAYHQPGAYMMAMGYNPVWDNIEEFAKQIFPIQSACLIWIENYVKFSEIFAANIFSVTYNLEIGKVFNHLTLVLAFCYLFYVLSKAKLFKFNRYSPSSPSLSVRLVFSFLLIYNPVVLCQVLTYYVDGLLYLYYLVAAFSIVDFYLDEENRTLPLLIFIMSVVICANIKLGGLLCLLCLILCGLFFIKNAVKLKLFCASVLISIFLILLSGINPYFTNIKQGRNPIYPLAGEGKIDIIIPNSPKSFEGKSPLYNFFIATFSEAGNMHNSDEQPKLKLPFSIHKGEIEQFRNTDARISGFGVFFSGIFILSLIMIILTRYKAREDKKLFMLLFALFSLPVVLNPECWWARYAPTLWACAIIAIMAFYINSDNKFKKIFVYITILIVFVNSLIANIEAFHVSKKYKKAVLKTIKANKRQNKEIILYAGKQPLFEVTFLQKLEQNGVKYRLITKDEYIKNMDSFTVFPRSLMNEWQYKNYD